MLKNIVLSTSFIALFAVPVMAQDDFADELANEIEIIEEPVSSDGFEDIGEENAGEFEDIGDVDFSEEEDSGSFEEFEEFAEEPPQQPTEPPVQQTAEPETPEDNLEPLLPTEETGPEPVFADPEFEPEPVEETPPVVQTPPALIGESPLWDEPDLELEAKLFDIYINYHSKPVTEGEWNQLMVGRTVENYVIQNRDTLWDISKTLFGDGNYWPKIWSLNGKISNPHLIQPKNTIRFFLGDEAGPPAFTVSEAESGEMPMEDSSPSNEPDIPPPSTRSRPVVKRLPPSLPQWQDPTSVNQKFDDAGIDYGKRKIADVIDSIPLSSYVAEASPASLGRVEEIETGHNLAASLQYVYVTVTDGGDIGDIYLAVQDRGPVETNSKYIVNGNLGHGIEILGELQLVEKVNGENENKNGRLYRALVTRIVNPVQVGAILTTGRIENINLSEIGPRSQVVAQIVGGQLFNHRQVYAPESIAYLNKGENDGLQVGQILPIRANRKLRNEKSMVLGNVRSIGWLKIVRTSPNLATAVILRSWSDVLTGDLTGAGEFQRTSISPMNGGSEPATQTSLLQELGEGASESPAENGSEDFGDVEFGEDEIIEGEFGDDVFDESEFQ